MNPRSSWPRPRAMPPALPLAQAVEQLAAAMPAASFDPAPVDLAERVLSAM